MSTLRFISVIDDPGRIWTNYSVIDVQKQIRVCTSSDSKLADQIAGCLNTQWLNQVQEDIKQIGDCHETS